MTVLTVIQRVCMKIGIARPTAVFSSTERELQELAELANVASEAIVEAHDWQALTVEHTFTGDGVADSFAAPADYDRMITDGQLWNSQTNNPVDALSLNEWLGRETRGFDVYSAYTILGNEFRIRPTMAVGETCKMLYVKNTCVVGVADGTASNHADCFTADDDEFLLPDRLLRLGIIWRWRESKGLDYAEDMQNYELALAEEVLSEAGSKVLTFGTSKISGFKTAYPQAIVS